MRRVPADLRERLLGGLDQAIGDLLVDSELLPQPGGLGAHASPDLRLRVAQEALGLYNQLVDQFLMLIVRGQRVEQLRRERGHLDAAQCAGEVLADEVTHRLFAQRVEQPRQQRGEAAGNDAGSRPIGQPSGQHLREVDVGELRRNHLGRQEVALDELAQGLAEPVLLLRNDGGVRDGQSERPPEQRGDCEPVGQPADQSRLAERAQVTHPWMQRLIGAREQEDHGRSQQERERQALHGAQAGDGEVLVH